MSLESQDDHIGWKIFGIFILLGVGMLANGVAISTLWDWYATPLGAHRMPFASALGLSLIGKLILGNQYSEMKREIETSNSPIDTSLGMAWQSVSIPLISIFTGWIYLFFQ